MGRIPIIVDKSPEGFKVKTRKQRAAKARGLKRVRQWAHMLAEQWAKQPHEATPAQTIKIGDIPASYKRIPMLYSGVWGSAELAANPLHLLRMTKDNPDNFKAGGIHIPASAIDPENLESSLFNYLISRGFGRIVVRGKNKKIPLYGVSFAGQPYKGFPSKTRMVQYISRRLGIAGRVSIVRLDRTGSIMGHNYRDALEAYAHLSGISVDIKGDVFHPLIRQVSNGGELWYMFQAFPNEIWSALYALVITRVRKETRRVQPEDIDEAVAFAFNIALSGADNRHWEKRATAKRYGEDMKPARYNGAIWFIRHLAGAAKAGLMESFKKMTRAREVSRRVGFSTFEVDGETVVTENNPTFPNGAPTEYVPPVRSERMAMLFGRDASQAIGLDGESYSVSGASIGEFRTTQGNEFIAEVDDRLDNEQAFNQGFFGKLAPEDWAVLTMEQRDTLHLLSRGLTLQNIGEVKGKDRTTIRDHIGSAKRRIENARRDREEVVK